MLRPFGLNDAAEVERLSGDWAIADTTQHIPHPHEYGVAEEWISKHQEEFNKEQGGSFAIARKADGALAGAISLSGIAKNHQAELGYWVGKPS